MKLHDIILYYNVHKVFKLFFYTFFAGTSATTGNQYTPASSALNELQNSDQNFSNVNIPQQNNFHDVIQHNDVALQRLMVFFNFYFLYI